MRNYGEMLELAYEKHERFEEAEARYQAEKNDVTRYRSAKAAAEASAYMDAIADMFGKGYDQVYEAVNGLAKYPRCKACGHHVTHTGYVDGEDVYCEACATPALQECRICMHCHKPMVDGMTNLETVYTHEDCFKPWMDENCPEGWRQVDDDGCEGYYEERINGEWMGTGIFYTK